MSGENAELREAQCPRCGSKDVDITFGAGGIEKRGNEFLCRCYDCLTVYKLGDPPSIREPQLTPSDHAYTILQDHGPENGGWGPAVVMMPGLGFAAPFIYTGDDERSLEAAKQLVRMAAQDTGKPTRLVKYTQREDVFGVGGSS